MNRPLSKKQLKSSRFYNDVIRHGRKMFRNSKRLGTKVALADNVGKQNLMHNLAQLQIPQKKG